MRWFRFFSPVLLLLHLAVALSWADTNVSGPITTDTAWTPAGGTYLVTGSVTVAPGVTLTIQPGVVVKFGLEQSLFVDGTLVAVGSEAAPVYFTEERDDAVGGDSNGDGNASSPGPGYWQSIHVNDGGSATLEHAVLRYGGRPGRYQPPYGIVHKSGGSGLLSMRHSTVAFGQYFGVQIEGGNSPHVLDNVTATGNGNHGFYLENAGSAVTVANSAVTGSGSYGVFVSASAPLLRNNAFTANTGYNLYFRGALAASSVLDGNTLTDGPGLAAIGTAIEASGVAVPDNNVFSGPIQVEGGTIDAAVTPVVTWSQNRVYFLTGSFTIGTGATLNVAPGRVVKLGVEYVVSVNGTLNAIGTQAQPIFFTEHRDDVGGDSNFDNNASTPGPGYWQSIHVNDGGSATLEHAVLRYGGRPGRYQPPYGIVHKSGGSGLLSMRHSTVAFGQYFGVQIEGGNSPHVLDNVTATGNGNHGFYLENAGSAVTVANSAVTGSGSYGVFVSASAPLLRNNAFTANTGYNLYFRGALAAASVLDGNTLTDGPGLAAIGTAIEASGVAVPDNNVFAGPIQVEGGTIDAAVTPVLTWSQNRVYFLTGSFTIGPGATLNVAPGRVVKLGVEYVVSVNGTLNAIGTQAQPIFFTEHRDDVGGDSNFDNNASTPGPGYWQSIHVNDGGSATLEHAVLRYGGRPGRYQPPYGIVHKSGGSGLLSMRHSTVAFGQYFGVQIEGGNSPHVLDNVTATGNGNHGFYLENAGSAVTVANSAVTGSGSYGVFVSASAPLLRNNAFTANTGYNLYFRGALAAASVLDGNTLTDGPGLAAIGTAIEASGVAVPDNNVFSGPIQVEGGTIDAAVTPVVTWSQNRVYFLTGSFTIGPGATLNVAPGRVVKLGVEYVVSVNGTLNAIGTQAQPIFFTEHRDDVGGDSNFDNNASSPGPGYWQSIHVNDGGSATLEHAVLRYGGRPGRYQPPYGIVHKSGGSGLLSMRHSTVAFGQYFGVQIEGGNSPHVLDNVTATGNGSYGVFVSGNAPVLRNNTFTGNTGYNLYLSGVASAATVVENNTLTDSAALGAVGVTVEASGVAVADNNVFAGPIHVEAGTLDNNVTPAVTWGSERVYYLRGVVTVGANATLTLPPGRIVKIAYGQYLAVNGTLNAVGAEGRPIVLTDFRDDAFGGDSNLDNSASAPAPGWWNALFVNDGGSATIDHAILRYGGYQGYWRDPVYGAVYKAGAGTLALRNSVVENNRFYGVQVIDTTGAHAIDNVAVQGNGSHGIYLERAGNAVGIANSRVTGSGSYGVYISASAPRLRNNTFTGNTGYNLYLSGVASAATVVENNTLTDSAALGAVGVTVEASGVAIADNNVFAGPIHVEAGTLDNNVTPAVTWGSDRVYYLRGVVTVGANATLTLPPGRIVKFAAGQYLGVNGTLDAVGAEGRPIVLTDFRDDAFGGDSNLDNSASAPAPGWWNALFVNDGGSATIDHAILRYGGYQGYWRDPVYGAVYKAGAGTLALRNSVVENNRFYGVEIVSTAGAHLLDNVASRGNGSHGFYLESAGSSVGIANSVSAGNGDGGIRISDSSPAITRARISGNTGAGVSVSGASSTPAVRRSRIFSNAVGVDAGGGAAPLVGGAPGDGNDIYGNSQFGVRNATSTLDVNATRNWWGSATGPFHPVTHAAGLGNAVSDNVDYAGFASAPAVGGPIMTVSTDNVALGLIPRAGIASRTFTVGNRGTDALSWSAATDNGWLSVSPTSGSVDAGQPDATLRLSVDPSGLAPGAHTGHITLADPGASGSPAVVTVTLTLPGDHFADPAPTPFSVAISGTLKKDGIAVPAGDEVAVFSVHPKALSPGKWEKTLVAHATILSDGTLSAMPVYGDDPVTTDNVEGCVPGEEMLLALWSASEGKAYYAVLDGASGLPVSLAWDNASIPPPVDLNFVEGQRIPLRTGSWNLISVGVLRGVRATGGQTSPQQLAGATYDNVASMELAAPLKSIEGKYDRVMGSDGSGVRSWNPAQPLFATLKSLQPGYGYWVKAKASPQPLVWMTFPGPMARGDETLDLKTGWTLLGYWGNERVYHDPSIAAPAALLLPVSASDNVQVATVGDVWAGVSGNYDRVIAFDTGVKLWNPAQPGFATMKYLGPGYGYWIRMRSDQTLAYPAGTR